MGVGFGENQYPNLEIHLPRHQEKEEQKGCGERWRVHLHPLVQGGTLVVKARRRRSLTRRTLNDKPMLKVNW
jgi:hypothetical protein